jgi:hypothetical protein
MSHNLLSRPALACSTSDVAWQLSCSLLVKHREGSMRATISLQFSIPIQGFDEEQTFTCLYNADNLVPNKISLQDPIIIPSHAQLVEIARPGNFQLKTLSLNIRTPCPIWCPAFSGSIASKDGFDAPFHQLVNLAKATEILVLFDLNWLNPNKKEQLQRLITHIEEFDGFPIDEDNAKGRRLADWSVFSPIEDALPEALPSYFEASQKRSRQGEFFYTG